MEANGGPEEDTKEAERETWDKKELMNWDKVMSPVRADFGEGRLA